MIAQWTYGIVGKMHIYRITQQELADEVGCSREYVNFVLNGKKNSRTAELKFSEALDRLIKKKNQRAKKEGA